MKSPRFAIENVLLHLSESGQRRGQIIEGLLYLHCSSRANRQAFRLSTRGSKLASHAKDLQIPNLSLIAELVLGKV